MFFVCSPDKTDTWSISNPKVNRILNKIAIRAISSFLFFENFTMNFRTFVYTHTVFFPLRFFGNNMKSEFLLIWTTLLRFFSLWGNTSERTNLSLIKCRKSAASTQFNHKALCNVVSVAVLGIFFQLLY